MLSTPGPAGCRHQARDSRGACDYNVDANKKEKKCTALVFFFFLKEKQCLAFRSNCCEKRIYKADVNKQEQQQGTSKTEILLCLLELGP